MDETWAYICPPESWPAELYNLHEDPDQLHNVAEGYPEVAWRMRQALLDFLREMGAPLERIRKYQEH
jgi:hypothetical protein